MSIIDWGKITHTSETVFEQKLDSYFLKSVFKKFQTFQELYWYLEKERKK